MTWFGSLPIQESHVIHALASIFANNIIIIITIFIEEAFSLKSGLQKGPQKIKNLQYWMLKMFKKKLRLRLKTNAKLKLRLRLKTNAS